jgi:hypothetical protein
MIELAAEKKAAAITVRQREVVALIAAVLERRRARLVSRGHKRTATSFGRSSEWLAGVRSRSPFDC